MVARRNIPLSFISKSTPMQSFHSGKCPHRYAGSGDTFDLFLICLCQHKVILSGTSFVSVFLSSL